MPVTIHRRATWAEYVGPMLRVHAAADPVPSTSPNLSPGIRKLLPAISNKRRMIKDKEVYAIGNRESGIVNREP